MVEEGESREEARIASRIVTANSGREVAERSYPVEATGALEARVERRRLRSSNSSNKPEGGGVGSRSSSSEVRERKVEATEPGDAGFVVGGADRIVARVFLQV